MSNDDENAPDYDVGYKKPPKHAQFQKGRSGNPSGKRKEKKGPNFSDTLQDVYAEIVNVSLNGKPKSMTRKEWFVETLGMRAAKGDVRSLRRLLDLYDAEEPHEMEPIVVNLTAEDARAVGSRAR